METNTLPIIIPEVDNRDLAFGTTEGLPEYKSIPEEFGMHHSSNKWVKFFDDMFFSGIKNLQLVPKPGIDSEKAFLHIRALMVSRKPRHEHKTAGCAFLMSQYFDDVTYIKNKNETHI